MKPSFLKIMGTVVAVSILTMTAGVASASPVAVQEKKVVRVAAKVKFKTPKITGLKNVRMPTKRSGSWGNSVKTVKFNVTITGPKSSNYTYKFAHRNNKQPSIKLLKRNNKIDPKIVSAIYFDALPAAKVGKNKFTFKISDRSTPGKYRISIPVEQTNIKTDKKLYKTVKKIITIRPTKKLSINNTSGSVSGFPKATTTLELSAMPYQAGAKVRIYYKASGKKKYTKIKTATLKRFSENSSKAVTKLSKKYNVRGQKGKMYFKISSTPYAPAYKSKTLNF